MAVNNFTFQEFILMRPLQDVTEVKKVIVVLNENVVTAIPMQEHQLFYLRARFYTGLVAFPIIGFLGLIGNIISVIVMAQPPMKSSTYTYLLALAVSDGVKLLSDLMYFLVILLDHTDPAVGTRAYNILYPYAHYIFNASLCISAWLTVSVSAERYIYICHPTKVKSYCSIRKAKAVSISVYALMSVLAIPYAMRYRTVDNPDNNNMTVVSSVNVTDLWNNVHFSKIFTWAQFFIRSILPLLLLIILNSCIICGLKNCKPLGRGVGARKHRITIMLLAVVLVFMVCTIPDSVMSSIFGVGYHEESYLRRGIREITDFLILLNSAVNFILYCIFNTIFRQSFARLFCRSCVTVSDGLALFQGRSTTKSLHPPLLLMSMSRKSDHAIDDDET